MHRPGIEPGSTAWKAIILPLNHRCLSDTSKANSHKSTTSYILDCIELCTLPNDNKYYNNYFAINLG